MLSNSWKKYEAKLNKLPKFSETPKRLHERRLEKQVNKTRGAMKDTMNVIDENNEEIGILLRENEEHQNGDRTKIFKQLEE